MIIHRHHVLQFIFATIYTLASLQSRIAFCEEGWSQLTATVLQSSADGYYVDKGREDGIVAGLEGEVRKDGVMTGRVRVLTVSRSTALVRTLPGTVVEAPETSDSVIFLVDITDEANAPVPSKSKTLKNSDGNEKFEPLLALPREARRALESTTDIFHGQAWFRQLIQVETESVGDFSISRMGSSGSYQRIQGSPWTLDWSFDMSYRTGEALSETRDYQDIVARFFRMSLYRKFEDDSFLRLGRFLPGELPGVGYVDGAQFEKVLGDIMSVGTVMGFKPTRSRLEFNADEPLATVYTTIATGNRETVYYSGTAGLLGSLFEGKADRLAFLLDQRATFYRDFSFFSTSTVDFDVGGAESRSGATLSRLDAYLMYSKFRIFAPRIGIDQFSPVDTQAQREFFGIPDDRELSDGPWRYFVGASHALPWGFRVREELAWIDSEINNTVHWNVTIAKTGLPYLRTSSARVTVYNLAGQRLTGYGARMSAQFLFLDDSLIITPSLVMRFADQGDAASFRFTDVGARAQWFPTANWSFYLGAYSGFGTQANAIVVDFGATFRW